MTSPVAVPLGFDGRGRTSEALRERHLLDLIEAVLFTSPGERVMRPDFGSGLSQLVFAPNSDQLTTTVQFLVNGALHQWLGDLIEVVEVRIDQHDSTLSISIDYRTRLSGELTTATVERAL
jgi:phage baseplate assembly protein W